MKITKRQLKRIIREALILEKYNPILFDNGMRVTFKMPKSDSQEMNDAAAGLGKNTLAKLKPGTRKSLRAPGDLVGTLTKIYKPLIDAWSEFGLEYKIYTQGADDDATFQISIVGDGEHFRGQAGLLQVPSEDSEVRLEAEQAKRAVEELKAALGI